MRPRGLDKLTHGALLSAPMNTIAGNETYASWLSRKLDEGNFTVRGFAMKMNPENPEIARRTLRRYLSGQYVPRQAARDEIAAQLGSTETGPTASDDDEEDDLLAALERRVNELSLLIQQARNSNAAAAHLPGSTAAASTQGG